MGVEGLIFYETVLVDVALWTGVEEEVTHLGEGFPGEWNQK